MQQLYRDEVHVPGRGALWRPVALRGSVVGRGDTVRSRPVELPLLGRASPAGGWCMSGQCLVSAPGNHGSGLAVLPLLRQAGDCPCAACCMLPGVASGQSWGTAAGRNGRQAGGCHQGPLRAIRRRMCQVTRQGECREMNRGAACPRGEAALATNMQKGPCRCGTGPLRSGHQIRTAARRCPLPSSRRGRSSTARKAPSGRWRRCPR